MDKISVLVCDDSVLMRNLISRIVNETEGMTVVEKAENGKDLLDKLPSSNPDIILLDVQMPVMDGVEFLKERKKRNIDVPVVLLSAVASEGAAVTVECLNLGASDFITKPGGASVTLKITDVEQDIIEYVASYGGAYAAMRGKKIPEPDFFIHQKKLKQAERFVAQKKGDEAAKLGTITKSDLGTSAPTLWNSTKKKEPAVVTSSREGGRIDIIALGISTGGPNALRDVFKDLDPSIKQPMLVVQHMPAGFTEEFAHSLDNLCPLKVTEGKDGEKIEKAHIYIAPGGYHMFVEHRADGDYIKTSLDEPRNGHRPSADVLFESVAKIYQNHALGVIMTGMGKDGAQQITEMRKQGAWTLGQDQASSIVYGMPRVAYELGGVQKQVPLNQMAAEISKLAKEHEVV